MRLLLIAAFLVFSFGTYAQSSKEEKVWNRVEALHKAIFETKDSVALKDLVSADVTYGHSGGNTEDKAEMVTKAATSKTQYKNSVFERQSIDLGKKTAIVRHAFHAISVDPQGKESPLDLGILQVWKKENGKWRIWARQAVKIAPKK
jgi:hypothetical protein